MGELYVVIRHKMVFDRIDKIEAAETCLGRDHNSGIWLPDPFVSRRHAFLIHDGDKCLIRDLGSRNGTRVKGALITSDQVLSNGDEVEIGPYLVTVCFSVADALRNTVRTDDSTNSMSAHVAIDEQFESKIPPLTPGQRRVFALFLEGLSEKEIAIRLGITFNTVHSHTKGIYKALSVSTRGELMARWVTHPGQQTDDG